jgi:glycosyltransferase involved in cell wall biosynthesis
MACVRVAFVTNVMPHYRQAFFAELFMRPELALTVYCQAAIPGMNLTTVHDKFPGHVRLVPAVTASRERIGWQILPWRELLRDYDVLFVQGNPRILSNVAFASTARLLGRHVVIWGQAHTAGAGRFSEALRLCWWRLFRRIFVYTDREAQWLRGKRFTRQVILGMNNGLDQRRIDAVAASWSVASLAEWRRDHGIDRNCLVLSCARLEKKNYFDLWVEALPNVLKRFPGLLWCVIGEGSEAEPLRQRARDIGVEHAIRWLGTITDEDKLAPWFLSSRCLVHPAGIGLTLLHAFGYGLPVVTGDDADGQMPEYAAFTDGETGVTFAAGNAMALASAAFALIDDTELRARMSAGALKIAREQYNAAVMAERFVEMSVKTAQ